MTAFCIHSLHYIQGAHVMRTAKLFALLLITLTYHSAFAEPTPELVYNLKGTIVKIHTVTTKGGHGSGSGFVVAKDLVATNCHVLTNAVGVNIGVHGETYIPVGVRADWKHDVCILRVEYLPLKPAVFDESERLVYETPTFSIGFPGGAAKPLTTIGKIKALYPFDESQVIRTSASFQMGASGSPLFNDQGKVIGMSTFKSPGAQGYFYNVPAKWIKAAMTLPESDKLTQTATPFWDLPLEQRPYWMQVVLPMQAEKWNDVLDIAAAWVKSTPKDPESYYYLALAQQHLGEIQTAKSNYQMVLQANPHHTASIVALAKIAKTQDNQSELTQLSQMLGMLDNEALLSLNAPGQ